MNSQGICRPSRIHSQRRSRSCRTDRWRASSSSHNQASQRSPASSRSAGRWPSLLWWRGRTHGYIKLNGTEIWNWSSHRGTDGSELTGETFAKHFDWCRPFGVPNFLVPLLQSVSLKREIRAHVIINTIRYNYKDTSGFCTRFSQVQQSFLGTFHVLCFPVSTFSKNVVVILCFVCVCVFVWYQCRAGDTLKPPFTTHNPVCSTPAKVYAKLSQCAVISGHCALVGAWVSMQTAIMCWWELALACATQHPPHSSILHTNVPQASSHTANVQMRCLVIYSMYTFDTSAKNPVIQER